eukprot:gene655-2089_t
MSVLRFFLLLRLLALPAWARVSPRIYIYENVPSAQDRQLMPQEYLLLERLRKSPYVTRNISDADYYWIPRNWDYMQEGVNSSMQEAFKYIKKTYPDQWTGNYARHIMTMLCDHGPADCTLPEGIAKFPDENLSPDINPANPFRNVMYLMFNGHTDRFMGDQHGEVHCFTCFQRDKDIIIPTMENMDRFMGDQPGEVQCFTCFQRGMDIMIPTMENRDSVWSLYYPPRGAQPGERGESFIAKLDASVDAWLAIPRKYTLFYGGQMSNCLQCFRNGRQDLWEGHRHRSDYLLHDTAKPLNEASQSNGMIIVNPAQGSKLNDAQEEGGKVEGGKEEGAPQEEGGKKDRMEESGKEESSKVELGEEERGKKEAKEEGGKEERGQQKGAPHEEGGKKDGKQEGAPREEGGKEERDKEKPFMKFYEAMQDSVFCFSPLGHDMGDTDRYDHLASPGLAPG